VSGDLILAVLHDEWVKRGGAFPIEHQVEIAHVIQRRVRAITGGDEAIPTKPRSAASVRAFEPVAAASWYDREPGDDDQ
jgi:hypothetical protein